MDAKLSRAALSSTGSSYTARRPSWIEVAREYGSGTQLDGPHRDSKWASSVVRYDQGASLGSHEHAFGEAFLIPCGTFANKTGSIHPLLEEPVYAGLATTGCNHLVVTEIDLARLGGMTLFPEQQTYKIDSLLENSHKIPAVHEQY